MKRFAALLKDTWPLWIVFSIAIVAASLWLSPIMLCLVPMLTCVFVYFALVRYDENGNCIGS